MWVREVKIHVVAYKRCQLPVRVLYCSVCSLMQKVGVSDLYLAVFFILVTETQQQCLSEHRGPFVFLVDVFSFFFFCLEMLPNVTAHSHSRAKQTK